MTQSIRVLLGFFIISVVCVIGEVSFLFATRTLDAKRLEHKALFTSMVGLPDLSLSSEARYIRHRSLSDVFSIFSESPEVLEYFPSTFVYHHAPHLLLDAKGVNP